MRKVSNKIKTLIMLSLVLSVATFGYLTVRFATYVATKPQTFTGKAATEREVRLNFNPTNVELPLNSDLYAAPNVLAPIDKKIASIRLTILFDKTKLNLKSIDELPTDTKLVLLKSSSVQDANNGGILKVLYGAISPDDAPQAAILPKLNFHIIQNGDSDIRFDLVTSQVVFTSEEIGDLVEGSKTHVTTNISTPAPTNTAGEISPTAASTTTAAPIQVSVTLAQPTRSPSATGVPATPTSAPHGGTK